MDLLARLKSPSVIVSSLHLTGAKFEALEHMAFAPRRQIVLTRKKGEDLPTGWQQMWEMEEAGWVELNGQKVDPDTRGVEYTFAMTDAGYQQWTKGKGVDIPPPPPPKEKKVRRRGPAAKTGKPYE